MPSHKLQGISQLKDREKPKGNTKLKKWKKHTYQSQTEATLMDESNKQ